MNAVLVLRRADLPTRWLPQRGAIRLAFTDWLTGVARAEPLWCPRETAERDPRCKQLIPYLVVGCGDPVKLAVYPRRGREGRLHGRFSLGLGGHIEPQDEGPGLGDTVRRGARRELREELGVAGPVSLEFRGLVNEEETEVGRVHLGLVFSVRIPHPPASPGDPELSGLEWLAPAEARGRPLELWSELALDLVAAG